MSEPSFGSAVSSRRTTRSWPSRSLGRRVRNQTALGRPRERGHAPVRVSSSLARVATISAGDAGKPLGRSSGLRVEMMNAK
jgi:hypothetical protein